ncbi:MAG TPA: enoyl-CoA hydratase-related protein [Deltaproteobacteria bacterium]|nr:enoyl-CoA hydratase-related protein [Deltaproteobacteria bacterium]HPR50867.1 enoyl-CoA hydratase-related protein [Deltaproteobacteria bacterium]
MNPHMPSFATITFEEVEPQIALVKLNRPDTLNAMNMDMLDDFGRLFEILSADDSIRVVILAGNGRGFSSGADLNDAVSHSDSEAFSDPETFLKLVQEKYSALITGLRGIPQPVIAAVNGAAAGGGFCLALASDIRIAADNAYFVASFINIGLSGGELGSSYLLPRLVGLSRAADILCTGRKVDAFEADRIGLVSAVVPQENLLAKALEYARMMTGKSVGGLKLTKRVLQQNIDSQSLGSAIELENRNQTILLFSGDFFRLIKSFATKHDDGFT